MNNGLSPAVAAKVRHILLHARRAQQTTPESVKDRIKSEYAEKFHCLFDFHPYKILYGGRYATKSWIFSNLALHRGIEKPVRIVCLRETMKSIEDSVHALMKDQIARLGLEQYYRPMDQEIRSSTGTNIFYAHLKGNVTGIKSMEGCDIFWV